MISICLTYFASLTLANLSAALYSVRQQDLSIVSEIVIVDNNTSDDVAEIQAAIDAQAFPVPVRVVSHKHGDPSKTHAWSSNVAVREARTPWVLMTRADYLLAFCVLDRFAAAISGKPDAWDGFVTGNGCHLYEDIDACERSPWRSVGPHVLDGVTFDYTCIDSGVWLARRDAFERVGGLDEGLTAWGHAQTAFQYALHTSGTECVRIPETLFYHPQHAAARDIDLAHQQLHDRGLSLKTLWARHEGVQPYQ